MSETQTKLTLDQKHLKEKILIQDAKVQQICDQVNENLAVTQELKAEKTEELKNQSSQVKPEIKQKYQTKIQNQHQELKVLTQKTDEAYNEFVKLKKSTDAKSLKKEAQMALNSLKSQIKVEKQEIKTKFVNNQEKIKNEYHKVDEKYALELKTVQENYATFKPSMSKLTLTLTFALASVLVLIFVLVINYLVYYPQANKEKNNGEPKPYPWGDASTIGAIVLSVILILLAVGIGYLLIKDSSKRLASERKTNTLSKGMIIGFVTDFFDTIGIGSFAPTVVMIKAMKANEDDKKLPGILNSGHTIPVIFEAVIFIAAVEVEIPTLIFLLGLSAVGGYVGAFLANKVNSLYIKLIMGIVLFITAILMLLNHPQIDVIKGSGTAIGLDPAGWKFYVGGAIFFILGILMSFGVGLYAPAMAVVALLGMDLMTAYPIMMGSTALLMPFGSIRFIQDKNYAPKISVGISIGGVVGVSAAFLLVFVGVQVGAGVNKNVFVQYLLYVVVVVIFYASFSLLYDFWKTRKKQLSTQVETPDKIVAVV